MGLVKFGQTTLNIAEIPDGHTVIPEQELSSLRQSHNNYLALKSKIPIGIADDQIASLIEKGARYDPLNQQLGERVAKVTELEGKLQGFSNLPKEFSTDKWNQYVEQEQNTIWAGKINKLTERVYEKVFKDSGVKIEVDPRFIPADVLDTFDPDANDSFDKFYKILDDAHTAQLNFVKQMTGQQVAPPTVGAGGQPGQPGVQQPTQPTFDVAKPRVGGFDRG